ncbi:diheme cytochrome c [Paraburkholderia phymatum]|uniref:Diheme cytochrome c n=1 Tax=Paraburkholderia phymatum (strain DSM 17167 / CIP 108236 / LMG 21445 / STM815) TaxID=391038 RepID=B2JWN7_PARP8|nr:diheme cytochrome c [Paraburkholderia phymatum]ACC75364.1 diheme cytochrome c [Paraburkholderia phymatum STM815]
MRFQLVSRSVEVGIVTLLAALTASIATAEPEGTASQVNVLPRYRQECATCHLAYPPGMLPAASWQRILGNLQHHFGTDASLDADSVRQISTWLAANSAGDTAAHAAPPEDRITRSHWFREEHAEVAADVWKRPMIKSASNCAACHTRAEQGNFNEHFIRIPQ